MTAHLDLELSAYLDEELDAAERTRVEAHLAGCEACRAALEDIRRLVRRAGTLDDRAPERDLWPAIASRITSASTADVIPLAPRRHRVSFSLPQLAAAALALMAVSSGLAVVAVRGGPAPATTAAPAEAGVRPVAMLPEQAGLASYDTAIADLQHALDVRRDELDTATVRVIEQSLQAIDGAIVQARAALARDPDNPYLNGHLTRSLGRKLEFLRQVATLTVES